MTRWFGITTASKDIMVIVILKQWAVKGESPYKEHRLATLNCVSVILKYCCIQELTLFLKSFLDHQGNTGDKGEQASGNCGIFGGDFLFLHSEDIRGQMDVSLETIRRGYLSLPKSKCLSLELSWMCVCVCVCVVWNIVIWHLPSLYLCAHICIYLDAHIYTHIHTHPK